MMEEKGREGKGGEDKGEETMGGEGRKEKGAILTCYENLGELLSETVVRFTLLPVDRRKRQVGVRECVERLRRKRTGRRFRSRL